LGFDAFCLDAADEPAKPAADDCASDAAHRAAAGVGIGVAYVSDEHIVRRLHLAAADIRFSLKIAAIGEFKFLLQGRKAGPAIDELETA